MKFLTDITLGKLTKWLRILGYDTRWHHGCLAPSHLRMAEQEGRLVLTRNRALKPEKDPAGLLVILQDKVEGQLEEVLIKLNLRYEPKQAFSRCLKCNVPLSPVAREEVAGLVPEYVLENYDDFRRCPECRGIFWPGTHRGKMQSFLKTHNRLDHP